MITSIDQEVTSEELHLVLRDSIEGIDDRETSDNLMSPRLYVAWKEDLQPFLAKSAEQAVNKEERFKVTLEGFFLLWFKALEQK